MNSPTSLIVHSCCAAVLVALSGCTTGNFRSDLGDGTRLPSLSPADDRPEHTLTDGASTRGLSRANWKPMVVGVPVYGVATNPTYTTQYRLTDETHRQRGEFPSAASSLDQFGDTQNEMRTEALAAPFVYVGDIILLIPRMIIQSPATEVRGPERVYARTDPGTSRRPLAAPPVAVPPRPEATPPAPDTDEDPSKQDKENSSGS